MKKIYLILFLFFVLQTYSQKTIYIYNFSSTNLDIGNIGTRHATSTFPMFVSNPSGGMITIPSNFIYILEADPASTTIFPFYSPSSSPEIDYWTRMLSGFPNTDLPSNLVASIYGGTQILDHFKFQLGPRGSLGGTTFFPDNENNYSETYGFGSTGVITIDIVDPMLGIPALDGETYIIVTD